MHGSSAPLAALRWRLATGGRRRHGMLIESLLQAFTYMGGCLLKPISTVPVHI
jgi:hypothetical protein